MSVRLERMDQFPAAIKKVKAVARFHLNSAAKSTETIARELAPVDTGYMRDHIAQTKEATEEDLQAVTESQADYSIYPEYGTVNQDAQPFMTPAFESAKSQLSRLRGIF